MEPGPGVSKPLLQGTETKTHTGVQKLQRDCSKLSYLTVCTAREQWTAWLKMPAPQSFMELKRRSPVTRGHSKNGCLCLFIWVFF